MFVYCDCLNVKIEFEGNDFAKVTLDTLNLNQEELSDEFFQKDLVRLEKLRNITKIHPYLVQTRNVGNWTINCCFNCCWETYAVHREKGASCVLACAKLKESELAEFIKNVEGVSKVYNIVINPGDNKANARILNLYRHCDPVSIEKHIRKTMVDFISKESQALEERIKKYAEEQYEMFNSLKDIAYEEHQTLVRLVKTISSNSPEQINISDKIMTANVPEASSTPVKIGQKQNSSFNSSKEASTPIRISAKRQKSSPAHLSTSIDAEGLFEFEGIDDANAVLETEYDTDKDLDDNEIMSSTSRSRAEPARNSLAKSLPINIPAFLTEARNSSVEDLDEDPDDQNLDIAASIKALAKSVHGDAVFGELPRPRFSYQI